MSLSTAPAALRRAPRELEAFATALFAAAGLERGMAESVGRLLVLTDMMGRRTHGLAQAGAYLAEIAAGRMETAGQPEVLRDTGATLVWDGGYRPGLWLVEQAMEQALARLPRHGVVTLAMRRSHHIGCLAALAVRATDAGCFVMLASSGPHSRIVAPFGGREALFSPNPFAVGFPAGAAPVLVDISASITTVSMTRQKAAAGEMFEHPWLLDAEGRPTRDPAVMEREASRGSLMLLGGPEAGHKGFGLGADGGGADPGPGRPWPAGRAGPLGRQRLPAGDGPRRLRRAGGLRGPDVLPGRGLPRQRAGRPRPPGAPAGRAGGARHRAGRGGGAGGAGRDRGRAARMVGAAGRRLSRLKPAAAQEKARELAAPGPSCVSGRRGGCRQPCFRCSSSLFIAAFLSVPSIAATSAASRSMASS
ncbi:Ldh family oxidoreductase [Teichococcus aestuarii]